MPAFGRRGGRHPHDRLVLTAAGLMALAGGAAFKFMLITRAAYNQGFALPHLPVRGARRRS